MGDVKFTFLKLCEQISIIFDPHNCVKYILFKEIVARDNRNKISNLNLYFIYHDIVL